MAWTAEDLEEVNQAIKKLVIGKRAVTVSYSNGGTARSVTYQMADLEQLQAIRAEIQRSLNGGASYRLGTVNKGLGS